MRDDERRPSALYGYTLRVSALTAVLGCAVLAGGFAAAWDTFEGIRAYADRNIANEDSYSAYAEDAMPQLARVFFAVTPLLLVVALLAMSALLSAYAVGDGSRSSGEVWRRVRRRLPAAFVVNVLTWSAVGAAELAAYAWGHDAAHDDGAWTDWLLPVALACLGPLLYSRLVVATAETVTGRNPFAALYRSWVLTRRVRSRALGAVVLGTVAAVLFVRLAMYAVAPLVHVVGLGMLRLSDDNVWITGVLVKVLPLGLALLLVPPVLLPAVCARAARLHRRLVEADEPAPAEEARGALR
ncbi:hypothetical protein [Streptomyces sp. SID9124]|uniref:hypothetical protein n=1 Tax=Streptomyces sp. SID9124 TaxID=2706108 RepID=UPI0013E040C5|nr:hypothetical protein [Streptomyces sp. SID9124]NED16400.1 hypothetical protein [Streptomyces sp. SID9124]